MVSGSRQGETSGVGEVSMPARVTQMGRRRKSMGLRPPPFYYLRHGSHTLGVDGTPAALL